MRSAKSQGQHQDEERLADFALVWMPTPPTPQPSLKAALAGTKDERQNEQADAQPVDDVAKLPNVVVIQKQDDDYADNTDTEV